MQPVPIQRRTFQTYALDYSPEGDRPLDRDDGVGWEIGAGMLRVVAAGHLLQQDGDTLLEQAQSLLRVEIPPPSGAMWQSGVLASAVGPLRWVRARRTPRSRTHAIMLLRPGMRLTLEYGCRPQPHVRVTASPGGRALGRSSSTVAVTYAVDLGAGEDDAFAELSTVVQNALQSHAVYQTPVRRRRVRIGGSVRLITAGMQGYQAETFTQPTWTPPDWSGYSAPVRQGYEEILNMVKARDPGEGRLAIVSGPPGTGKTYLLRGLAVDLSDYAPLIVPPDLAAQVGDPAFITYLRELRRADERAVVLLVEDADHLLRHRDHNPHGLSALSTVLNASDGILGGILDLRIVATINSNQSEDIDPAALRSGRLATHVQVGLLDKLDVARCWRRLMGERIPWPGPASATLADIYRAARAQGWQPGKARRRSSAHPAWEEVP